MHCIVSIILQVSLLDEADNSEDEGSVKEDNKKRSGNSLLLSINYLLHKTSGMENNSLLFSILLTVILNKNGNNSCTTMVLRLHFGK